MRLTGCWSGSLTRRTGAPPLVALTDQGSAVVEAVKAARVTEADRVFEQLSPADREDLARILRVLRH